MYIPPEKTEEEIVKTIEKVALRLARKFGFGYHSDEDIVQQAYIEVLRSNCLQQYDPKQPLENFLSIHIRNRLYNFKRDNYMRPEPPCSKCPLNAYINKKCTAYTNLSECKFYARWEGSNVSKRNIMNTINISNVNDQHEDSMRYSSDLLSSLRNVEMHQELMDKLSFKNRKNYLMFLNNCRVDSVQMKSLKNEIADILGLDYGEE